MRKTSINMMLFLPILAIAMGTQVTAQVSSTFAKNATAGQQNGLYYALPQTVLRLDFTIQETRMEDGPYSEYASLYLDGGDFYNWDEVKYEMLDVKLVTETNADPNATFFVSIGSGRGAVAVDMDLLENGIVRSIGVGAGAADGYEAPVAEPKPQVKAETVVQEVDFPLLKTTGKSEEQAAKEIVEKIFEIRDVRFKLNSCYYEVPLDEATLKLMMENLDKMEEQYKSLLLGKKSVKTYVQSVYVIPNKDITSMSVAKFSVTEGLTVGTGGSGNIINVQTLPLNTLSNINAPSQSAVESMTYEGKVFYRVPEMANVKVTCSGNVLLEERHQVNQLGVLLMAPVNNARIIFNTDTGQISSLSMDR